MLHSAEQRRVRLVVHHGQRPPLHGARLLRPPLHVFRRIVHLLVLPRIFVETLLAQVEVQLLLHARRVPRQAAASQLLRVRRLLQPRLVRVLRVLARNPRSERRRVLDLA